MRHVIEPELTYRFVGGIGSKARDVLMVDTTDIATDTDEVGFSLTQRFYLRPTVDQPCRVLDVTPALRAQPARVGQLADRAEILHQLQLRRGAYPRPPQRLRHHARFERQSPFLLDPRNLSPLTSRLRFEAIDNLRIQWDLDYDPKAGRLGADNLYRRV